QPHVMTQMGQLPRPVVSPAACFQRDRARRLRREEVEQLGPREPAAENRPARPIRTMRMENSLSDIQTDRGNLWHGRLLQVVFTTSTLAPRCRRRGSTPSTSGIQA